MKYSKADTHIHTSYSDGNNSPEDIVEAAAGKLGVIAVRPQQD
jgi:PHP domain.